MSIESRIGTDESGKGDYFGGLTVAGVYVDDSILTKLAVLNIRDSKKIKDSVVSELADSIKASCPHSIVIIGPEKYNELYDKLKNLNRILAWAHARAIENLLNQVDCKYAITDQFGDERFVLNALMKKGRTLKLEQRPRAEEDVAVAAASILARAEFLKQLDKLSKSVGVNLPKGASQEVENVGRTLVKEHGKDILRRVAKLHFKTTQVISGSASEAKQTTVRYDLERLWAPWRIRYILSFNKKGCIFCKALKQNRDEENYILTRGDKAFVVMNTFPYNNGHLMVAPMRHVGDIEKLDGEELNDMVKLVKKSVEALKKALKPDGFNLGMNLGKVAGAGVEGHLHIHIVPRWSGDTNFMPIISGTKIMSQALDEAYKMLKEHFAKI